MIKLNIQRFGHTNSTTNYNLPQFIGSDKPQWLTDINQAFASIDTAIHDAYALASLVNTNIGDLTDLDTTYKTDIVGSINEVVSETTSNTSTIASHTTAIQNNTTAIGNLVDLDTVDKNDLVSAINEVDLIATNNSSDINTIKSNIGNLSDLETSSKTNIVSAINELVDYHIMGPAVRYENNTSSVRLVNTSSHGGQFYVSKSADGGIFKVYGKCNFANTASGASITLLNTGVVASQEYSIFTPGFAYVRDTGAVINAALTMTIKTNGDITITIPDSNYIQSIFLYPCLYFNKNLGDQPE